MPGIDSRVSYIVIINSFRLRYYAIIRALIYIVIYISPKYFKKE
jgi:hypothetical protein